MFKKNTTIILGAGSSYDLGYPIGSELIDKVLRLSENNDTPNIVKEFAKTLKEFNPLSIDFFLSLHKNFADIGKEEIATAILECEEESKEKMIRSKNHWYKFLLNEILTGCENDKPDAINDNNLSIVTFNYDVSLEYFLYSRLLSMSYFQKGSENFAHNFLKKLEVEHVYGKVKNINSDNFGGYGKGSTLGASNNTLRVIGERGNNIDKIKHIPCSLVHGRYDVVCPVKNAWEMHKLWPEMQLFIEPTSGHSAFEKNITAKLVELTDSL